MPPALNLTNAAAAGVPIQMFSMKHDVMLRVEESRKIRDALGDGVEYTELDGGHMTYFVGKDLDWVKEHVVTALGKYNPIGGKGQRAEDGFSD